jgi:hypothetical protein
MLLGMPKRSSKCEETNQTAHRALMEAIGERPKTPVAPTPDETKNPKRSHLDV